MKQKKPSKPLKQHSKKYFEYQVCMDRGSALFLRYLLKASIDEAFYDTVRYFVPGYMLERQAFRITERLLSAFESVTSPQAKESYPSAKLNNQARRRSQNHRRAR